MGEPQVDAQNRILVTPRSLTREPHPAVDLLREEGYDVVTARPGEQPTEDELLRLLPGCVGYLAGVEPISARVLSAARGLVVISRNGVGSDNIDTAAAQEAGIRVLTTPGANSEGVAELTLGLMFALVRSLPAADRIIKSGGWERAIGLELKDRTLGVIGCGNIGQRVAGMALGIGMSVLGYDPYPAEGFDPPGFTWSGFGELLAKADIVTLHSPPAERPLIDKVRLERMKAGAYLINTARAQLVDQSAVLAALDEGILAGYAVDAHRIEPPRDLSLVGHPRVIATAHIGGYTRESVMRAAMGAARNLVTMLKGAVDG